MAVGWARDNAVQDQIDATVAAAVQREEPPKRGASLPHCEACREEIPEARREAIPGVRLCVACQGKLERTR